MNNLKPVTPESVKVLMIIELGLNVFFTYWIISEYQYNAYFHIYVDTMILAHLTTYTAALGVTIGLTGTAIAATLYRNLKHARLRLERLAETKLKPSIQKVIEKMPSLEVRPQPTTPSQIESGQPMNAASTNAVPSSATNASMPVLAVKPPEESKQQ